jgi:hypothetical protein
MAKKAAEESPKRTRVPQSVYEALWAVPVEDGFQDVVQLVAAKDFQSAFFKARRWAKENVVGELVRMGRKEGMVI